MGGPSRGACSVLGCGMSVPGHGRSGAVTGPWVSWEYLWVPLCAVYGEPPTVMMELGESLVHHPTQAQSRATVGRAEGSGTISRVNFGLHAGSLVALRPLSTWVALALRTLFACAALIGTKPGGFGLSEPTGPLSSSSPSHRVGPTSKLPRASHQARVNRFLCLRGHSLGSPRGAGWRSS